jgi:surface-anchored protein
MNTLRYSTAAAILVFPLSHALALEVFTDQHMDIGLGFLEGEWDLHVHDDIEDIEYAPDEALLHVGVEGRVTRSNSSAFAFVGVGPGEQYWLLPQGQKDGQIYLGIASETEGGEFASYRNSDPRVSGSGAFVTLTLKGVRGPGNVSIWSFDSEGQPLVWWATSDGVTSTDSLFILEGSHNHYNYGFTAPGIYEIDVQASAYLGPGMTNLTASEVTTYFFGVAIPEPTTALMLCTGGTILGLRHRRRIGR